MVCFFHTSQVLKIPDVSISLKTDQLRRENVQLSTRLVKKKKKKVLLCFFFFFLPLNVSSFSINVSLALGPLLFVCEGKSLCLCPMEAYTSP